MQKMDWNLPFHILISIIIYVVSVVEGLYSEENFKSKYEYKYSFKGPNLSQPGRGIPFWNHTFDAVPGQDQVRVVPSLRAKYGAVWNKNSFSSDEWKVEIAFRIQGRGRIGADGFAFWYVETPNVYGPVFGSMDNWKGLGIFFDSYDNDNRKNNPYISIVTNDGTLSYNHATDGTGQIQGGCMRDFRNRPYPVKARIIYTENQLELYIDSGNTPQEEFEICAIINDVTLPKEYYFGISAATGALADDHDILKFLTWSLTKRTPEDKPEEVPDEETKKKEEVQKRLQEEYEKNLQEFYTEQKKFQEEHPDKVKEEVASPNDLFQGSSSNELKAVFDVQSKIKDDVSQLSKSVVMVMEKQDKITSQIEQFKPSDLNLAKSYEVENLLKLQRSTQDTISEVKEHLNFLKSTTKTLSDGVSRMGTGSENADLANDSKRQLIEVMQKLDKLYDGIAAIDIDERNKPQLVCPEPEMPSCVNSAILLFVAAIQVIILIAYHSFKQSRVDAAKKFF